MPASSSSSPRTHRLRVKILLAIASAALCVLGLEIAFRVLAWREDRGILSNALLNDSPPPAGSTVRLRDVIRLSAHERIIYELKPDLPGVLFEGVRVFTNRRGFVTPESQIPKPEGTVRIIGLGDSVMFGWKMPQGKEYLAVLEQQLERRRPQQNWEVINTAVPGYNTVMEVETLQHKALDLEPDLVIVGLTRNDLDLPNFIRERRSYFSWRRCFVVDFFKERNKEAPQRDGLRPAPLEEDEADFLSDAPLVPTEYRDMVGTRGFASALNQLAALARQHDFGVIFVTMFGTRETRPLLERAREHGFDAIAVVPDLRDYRKRHGGKSLFDLGLFVDATDTHPSPTANEMIARALLAVLEQPEALNRLKAQVHAADQE